MNLFERIRRLFGRRRPEPVQCPRCGVMGVAWANPGEDIRVRCVCGADTLHMRGPKVVTPADFLPPDSDRRKP